MLLWRAGLDKIMCHNEFFPFFYFHDELGVLIQPTTEGIRVKLSWYIYSVCILLSFFPFVWTYWVNRGGCFLRILPLNSEYSLFPLNFHFKLRITAFFLWILTCFCQILGKHPEKKSHKCKNIKVRILILCHMYVITSPFTVEKLAEQAKWVSWCYSSADEMTFTFTSRAVTSLSSLNRRWPPSVRCQV